MEWDPPGFSARDTKTKPARIVGSITRGCTMCCTYICGGASKANSAGAETIPSPYTQERRKTKTDRTDYNYK